MTGGHGVMGVVMVEYQVWTGSQGHRKVFLKVKCFGIVSKGIHTLLY